MEEERGNREKRKRGQVGKGNRLDTRYKRNTKKKGKKGRIAVKEVQGSKGRRGQ